MENKPPYVFEHPFYDQQFLNSFLEKVEISGNAITFYFRFNSLGKTAYLFGKDSESSWVLYINSYKSLKRSACRLDKITNVCINGAPIIDEIQDSTVYIIGKSIISNTSVDFGYKRVGKLKYVDKEGKPVRIIFYRTAPAFTLTCQIHFLLPKNKLDIDNVYFDLAEPPDNQRYSFTFRQITLQMSTYPIHSEIL